MAGKDEVKDKIDIVDYIGRTVALKPSGRNFRGLCPFHQEKSPSFFVSPERQSYHCFGCGESGDIFSFYEKIEGVSFWQALKDLAVDAGVELTDFRPDQDFQLKQTLIEIHTLTAKYYAYLLNSHSVGKVGLEYLQNRQIPNSQIKDFQLGFAPNSWSSLTDFLLKKRYDDKLLEQSGLCLRSYQNNRLYDRFRGRIMFPLLDIRGNIVGFSGRVLPAFDDGKSGKYINSPETPIYHKSQMLFPLFSTKEYIRKANSVIVVEGELDALASIRAGVKNVVAVKGTAFTVDQVKILHRYTETIILSLDSDSAGVKAAKRSISVIKDFDLNVRVLQISGGKDPDEIVKEDPGKWREIVKKTDDIYDFFIDSAFSAYDFHDPTGQKQITNELLPLFAQIQNQVVQNHFLKKLASRLDVKPEILQSEMNRQGKVNQLPSSTTTTSVSLSQSENLIDQLLLSLLNLIINYFDSLDLSQIPLADFPPSGVTQIIENLITTKTKDPVIFAKSLPEHLRTSFDLAFLAEAPTLSTVELQKQFRFLISRIAKIALNDKLSQIRTKLKTTTDSDQLVNLKHQLQTVMVRFSSYKS